MHLSIDTTIVLRHMMLAFISSHPITPLLNWSQGKEEQKAIILRGGEKVYFFFFFLTLIFILCFRYNDQSFIRRPYLLGKDFYPCQGSFWNNSDFSGILTSLTSTPRISPSALCAAISQKSIKQREFPSVLKEHLWTGM